MGVNEIVSRANNLILIYGGTNIVFAAYAYVALWFLAAGLILTVAFRRIAQAFGQGGVGEGFNQQSSCPADYQTKSS